MKFFYLLFFITYLSFSNNQNIDYSYFDLQNVSPSFKKNIEEKIMFYKKKNDQYNLKKEKVYLGINYYYIGERKLAKKFLLENQDYFKNQKDKEIYLYILRYLSRIYILEENHKESFKLISEANELIIKYNINNSIYISFIIKNDLAWFYALYGNKELALKIINQNFNNSKLNDFYKISAYLNLGQIYSISSEFDIANKFFQKALKISNDKNLIIQKLYAIKALIYLNFCTENYYKVLEFADEMINISKLHNLQYLEFSGNLYIIDAYIFLDKLNLATIYFNKLSEIEVKKYGYWPHYMQTKIDFLLSKSEFKNAENILKLELQNHKFSEDNLSFFYQTFEQFFQSKNDYFKAYEYSNKKFNCLKKYQQYKNELNIDLIKYKLRLDETSNKLINERKNKIALIENQKNKTYLLSLIIIILFIISFFAVYYYKNIKKKYSLYKRIKEKENEIYKLKLEANEKEIEIKNSRLTDFSIFMREKTELLENIKTKINEVISKSPDTLVKIKPTIDFIDSMINQDNLSKENISLEENDFIDKLKINYPELNEKEIRIATLVKLNLQSKEISERLNISSAVINNYRTSIRKKLNLSRDVSLTDFLNNL